MIREYTEAEASEELGITVEDLIVLRKKVGIPVFGKLSEMNISAIRSYMSVVEGAKSDSGAVRTCVACNVSQPLSNFSRRGRGASHTCEACEAEEMAAKGYQQSCSPLGGDQMGGDCETTKNEAHSEDAAAETEIDDDAPCISRRKAKELVHEAYALGAEHGKRIAVNDRVSLFELLEVAACHQQISS